jgi:hypothetical protein
MTTGVYFQRTGILEQELAGGGGGSVVAFASFLQQTTYDDAMIADMTASDTAGNVYVSSNAMAVGQKDMSLTKYAADGTIAWRYSYPHVSAAGPGVENYRNRVADLKVDPSGNVFACYVDTGTANPNGTGISGEYRLTLIKFNSDGDILWQRTLRDEPTGQTFYFGSLAVDASGNAIVMFSAKLGLTAPSGTLSNTTRNTYIVKYDSSGTQVFERAYQPINDNSGNYEQRSDIITDATGNIYAQWMIWDKENIATIKLSPAGALLWDVYYSAWDVPYFSGFAEVGGLGISSDGSTLIRGYSFTDGGNTDPGILIKVNTTTGAVTDRRTIVGASEVFSRIYDVKIDPATDLVYIFGAQDKTVGAIQPYLLVIDLSFNIQYFHDYAIAPVGYQQIYIDYGPTTYTNRGPRISIGTDNISLAFLHDDNTAVNGLLLNFNKDGTGITAGTLVTSGRGVTYSLVTTGAPTFGTVTELSDQWGAPGNNSGGRVVDMSGTLTVAETGVTTFGTKVTLGALALPTITLL